MRGASLRQLRAFAAVARHQSFARAAAELHLTPSAVSLQIKELEQTVGIPLFGRSGKAPCLTPAGELLLLDVRRALLALQDADDTLARIQGRETGAVAIGMVSNAEYFLPRVLARFHEAHGGVELRVSVANREQLLRQLANHEVDLAVMGEPPPDLDIRSEGLSTQPLGILAAPEHRLSADRSIPVAALAQHEFIVREPGSGTRAAMDRFFRESRIAPPRVMELTSNETIKQAVIANMGLGFLSLHTARLEIEGRVLVVLDVVGLPVIRRWYVVHGGADPLSEAAESLRRFIIDWGRGMNERPCDTFKREPALGVAAAGIPAA